MRVKLKLQLHDIHKSQTESICRRFSMRSLREAGMDSHELETACRPTPSSWGQARDPGVSADVTHNMPVRKCSSGWGTKFRLTRGTKDALDQWASGIPPHFFGHGCRWLLQAVRSSDLPLKPGWHAVKVTNYGIQRPKNREPRRHPP